MSNARPDGFDEHAFNYRFFSSVRATPLPTVHYGFVRRIQNTLITFSFLSITMPPGLRARGTPFHARNQRLARRTKIKVFPRIKTKQKHPPIHGNACRFGSVIKNISFFSGLYGVPSLYYAPRELPVAYALE